MSKSVERFEKWWNEAKLARSCGMKHCAELAWQAAYRAGQESMREKCRLAAASWIDSKRTDDQNAVANAICGDILVLSLDD